ncbi:MupG family TIM beta-alpha barrel fold protein [Metabacillus niabensis]|uniref:MupG family TIM beta-alpha barrel fold protein n=1 Tax=Metabacillus niabensis TaxID=324854 RepID=UPI001CFAD017|nr:MupG family TIM beta-alpha barrel fold protein [Metabacillus niabensis]
MIGISFYLNDPLAEQRIVEACTKGVRRAFTSLHIPEEKGDLVSRAKKLLKVARDHGMEVFADVSMNTPKHLGIQSLHDLSTLGVIGVRLDDYFDFDMIIELSKQFHIALNASIILEEDIKALVANGIECERLIAWHNFYPRRETGLDDAFFLQQMTLFQRFNIPVYSFVPGRGEKRGPIFDGLPTLERHRDIDPFVSAVELYSHGIFDVYIGDPDAGEDLLEELVKYDEDKIVPVRFHSSVFQEGIYRPRPDFARDVIRLMDTRKEEPVPQYNTVERPRGSITMDNSGYGRYCGEVHITLRDLPADDRVNVIGHVHSEDIPLLSLLKPGQFMELKHIRT